MDRGKTVWGAGMKHGNMRTYGTVLTEKLVNEKCTTRASPCVRYFVDAEGNRISEPEKVITENAYIEPMEYRKRVENLKRDGKGKLAKLEATYKAITEVDEGEVLPLKTVPFAGTLEERADAIFVNPLKVSRESQEGTSETLEVVEVDNPVQEDKVELETKRWACFGNFNDSEPCRNNGCGEREKCLIESEDLAEEQSRKIDAYFRSEVKNEIEHQTDHPEQYETKDDLGGLAEPEPVWTSEYAEEQQSDRLAHKLDKSLKMSIAQMWIVLKNDIETIRQVYIAQAEQEFSERLNQILGVTK